MEKYKKIIQNLFSLFSNNNVVSQLKINAKILELAKKVINDLIYLEKNEQALYDDEKWSIIFAKAFVKILNKPITYEISNGQNIDGNLDNLNEYIFTKYNVDLKQENAIVSKELLSNIVETEKNRKIEVQTKNVDSSQTISLDSLNNNNAKTGSVNNQFSFESIKNLEPPHFNERFYPYKTKPKNIILCKKVLLVIFAIYLCIFVAFMGMKIYNILYLKDSSSNNSQTKVTIALNILSNIFISLTIYFVFRKPTKYSEQYHIRTSNLIFLSIFVFFEILIIFQDKNAVKKNILTIDSEQINKAIDYLEYALIIAYVSILIISIIILVINPKLDKDKLMKANMYYMRRVEDLNCGRQSSVNYEDLYDSQSEYDEFKRKYFSKKSKKENNAEN